MDLHENTICKCPAGSVFVFGSNEQGIHGAGAALHASIFHGAVQKVGEGLQGNSYALPTKSTPWVSLPLDAIEVYVNKFKTFAAKHPKRSFYVTPIGTGLAGYDSSDIGPLFFAAPDNIVFSHLNWEKYRTGHFADRTT